MGTTQSTPNIVRFSFRGISPDTRLKVFDDMEIHAHSEILKRNSMFFRKFLDSPEKACRDMGTAGLFQYEWVTEVEEDGMWHLVSANSLPADTRNTLDERTVQNRQQLALHKLLSAFYNQPYILHTIEELIALTDLADYYRALPAVSITLLRAIKNPESAFMETFLENRLEILEIAKKLRHSAMFREALILSLGPWNDPVFLQIEDRELADLAKKKHRAITFANVPANVSRHVKTNSLNNHQEDGM